MPVSSDRENSATDRGSGSPSARDSFLPTINPTTYHLPPGSSRHPLTTTSTTDNPVATHNSDSSIQRRTILQSRRGRPRGSFDNNPLTGNTLRGRRDRPSGPRVSHNQPRHPLSIDQYPSTSASNVPQGAKDVTVTLGPHVVPANVHTEHPSITDGPNHAAASVPPFGSLLQGGFSRALSPLSITPTVHTSQSILQGAKDFEIKNSVLTNVQGNAVIFRFDTGSTPGEEFKTVFVEHMMGLLTVQDLDRIEKRTLRQAIRDLPRATAAYNDYTSSKRRRTACFKNTRQALLEEIALHITNKDGPRAYLLFGIAGIGKSTVAQTVAERADNLRLLGASFFFSRDEADRRTAEKFFTSIAFQLCAHDKKFSEAIGAVLTEDRGAAATSKVPQEQLATLIIEPLRDLALSRLLPTIIVVDALDECDIADGPIILMALDQLVHELPFFKVILTTRPQPHLQYRLHKLGAHHLFRMEDIEEKIVEGDIQLYLKHSLSPNQVDNCLPMLRRKWGANDDEINSLVRAAGRLFIIASTAILYILDTTARDPESRMKTLQEQFARNRTSFSILNDFYTIILRGAVPLGCDDYLVGRYQVVVGTIVLIEDALPIKVLARLIGMLESGIYAVLDNLQSVISIGNGGVPLVYHKSFSDYITDVKRCQDANLCIVPRTHHTRLAACCLRIMNAHLKRNILGLTGAVQFLDNEKALEEDRLSGDSVQQAIPSELQYASIHWANHVAQADLSDSHLMTQLKRFAEEHLLHWLEALSWIRKLDTAHISLGAVLNLQTDMRQIFSDSFCFVSVHYEKLNQFATHAYHSALPFTPTESSLYKKYKHEILSCQVEGGPVHWDILITEKKHAVVYPVFRVFRIGFSKDSSRFASWDQLNIKIWDGATAVPVRTFDGNPIALADDFSILAVPQGSLVTMHSVSTSASIASFNHSSNVVKTAISFDGSRLAAWLQSGTVCVWDVAKGALITNLGDHDGCQLTFSPNGYTLAFTASSSTNLWNGADVVARLEHKPEMPVKFAFLGDGTRLVTLAINALVHTLRLWNCKDGNFIAIARDVGEEMAVSADGSLAATGGWRKEVQLWSGGSLALLDTLPIERTSSLAISSHMLAIGSWSANTVTLYDVNSRTFIRTLQTNGTMSLAFSHDGTRLATGTEFGGVHLLVVPSIRASTPASEQSLSPITALAFSPECTRVASGRSNGFVELWDTGDMRQAVARHAFGLGEISALAFSPDSDQLASGSTLGHLRFWDGRNGGQISIPEGFHQGLSFTSLAFSRSLLVAATADTIALLDRKSFCLIQTFDQGGSSLSFSRDGSLFAFVIISTQPSIMVWDTRKLEVATTFAVNETSIMLFLSPDGSKLAVQGKEAGFNFFDIGSKKKISDLENKDLSWVPHLNGIPISWNEDHLIGRFSARHDRVPVLYIPRDFDVQVFTSQSSMFALGCDDGRILLIRPPSITW